jgi:hypothetical protein
MRSSLLQRRASLRKICCQERASSSSVSAPPVSVSGAAPLTAPRAPVCADGISGRCRSAGAHFRARRSWNRMFLKASPGGVRDAAPPLHCH